MSNIVQREIDIVGEVPADVKTRVKKNLAGMNIDYSDIPELNKWLSPPVVVKVALDNDTARSLSEKAASSHQTLAQAIINLLNENKSAIV
jgi:hypothetical protein